MNFSTELKEKKEKLTIKFLKRKSPVFLNQNTALIDEYFEKSFARSIIGPQLTASHNPFAIIALGGYGRGEQCVHSDIDILFLFEKEIPDKAAELIREIIYPLWDIGMEVGHATRTIKDCIDLSGEDLEIMTSLLDARLICGMSNIYFNFHEKFRERVVTSQSKKLTGWLVDRSNERQNKSGDSTYLLEPDLKNGQGGLRDYHTMLWLARIKSDLLRKEEFETFGYLSKEEYKYFSESLIYIWNVRNRLHYFSNRKCDQLHHEYQEDIANSLKIKKKNGQQPVEVFLGELHEKMGIIKQHHLILVSEMSKRKKFNFRVNLMKRSKVENILISKGMLSFKSREAIPENPELLMEIFSESSRLKIPIDLESKRLIKEFGHLVKKFANSKKIIKSFEHILVMSPSVYNVLNEMLNTHFLVHLIPEFKGIVNRIQYSQYHVFPVDKHTLKTVFAIKQFSNPKSRYYNELCASIYKNLKSRKLVLWAALLHDIGKGLDGDKHAESGAVVVNTILKRINMKSSNIETVTFLVKEHLLLVNIATRRDLSLEETIVSCARKMKNSEYLNMLYLLTVADSMATGPKAWNDWTGTLFKELFKKTDDMLIKGKMSWEKQNRILKRKKLNIINSENSGFSREEFEAHFETISPRYLLSATEKEIIEHFKFFSSLKDQPIVWELKKEEGSDTRIFTVCAKDKPGLFSEISGVFTLNDINILDVQVYSWREDIAFDIFKLSPPKDLIFEDEKWERVGKHLVEVIENNIEILPLLQKKNLRMQESSSLPVKTREQKIVIDNKSSAFFTIIEVFSYDFPGLLFVITDTLLNLKIDIRVAKIATKVDQVLDIFYVRNFEGGKIESEERLSEIKESVLKKIEYKN